jgi:hypothetical protein
MKEKDAIKNYMSKIGRVGGKKSRRVLTTEQAQAMVERRQFLRKIAKKNAEAKNDTE